MMKGRRQSEKAKRDQFIFVAADSHGQSTSVPRKELRSHVMRGKNTRRQRQPRPPHAGSWMNVKVSSHKDDAEPEHRVAALLAHKMGIPPSANDFTLVKFVKDLDLATQSRLFNFFVAIKNIMYPIEWCCDLAVAETCFFNWLLYDEAYVHSILYVTDIFHHLAVGKDVSSVPNTHILWTIRLLNERLSKTGSDFAISDSTVGVIVSLASGALTFGHLDAAEAHVEGLRQIVKIRGGIEAFGHNHQLQVKICRVDWGYTLALGRKPIFFEDEITYDAFFDTSPVLSSARPKLNEEQRYARNLVDKIDPRLGNIFKDLQDFSRLADFLLQSGQKIEAGAFQDLMTNIQYRLFYLHFSTDDTLAEVLRLAMLAYLTTVYLKVPGIRLRYPLLARQLRDACQRFVPHTPGDKYLFIWALIIGFVSVFEKDANTLFDTAVSTNFDQVLGATWPDARRRLKAVMWIGGIHDLAGQELFSRHISVKGLREVSESPGYDVFVESQLRGGYDPAPCVADDLLFEVSSNGKALMTP